MPFDPSAKSLVAPEFAELWARSFLTMCYWSGFMPDPKTRSDRFEGFGHVANGELVDGSGNVLRLRGVGLGNWFLPEGYMWKFEPDGPLSPHEIEDFVVDLVGRERGARFWHEFRDRFITEADIARIADEGFDHVRLALNSRLLLTADGGIDEAGFALVDRLIGWCRAHQLWVVLDLHGAPGGQTGTNIDDSPRGVPDLFITGGAYTTRTIDLWRAIATRYRDETAVIAYDLLNEPLPNDYQFTYADALADLYQHLTKAIREIDPNHVIIYEGTHWSNNWSIFTQVWDPNSMLQCHKYWSAPDRPSVQGYLDISSELGLPVYMGETGENNLDWMQTAFQLYEECSMSWNLWPWKKIDTVTSPCSIDPPDGWSDVVNYARKRSDAKPDAERAWTILGDLLDRLDITRCTYRQDVVNAVMRRAPLRIPASGFGFGGEGVSYKTSAAVPMPGFRNDDSVTLVCPTSDGPSFHHNHGSPRGEDEHIVVRLGTGDWVAYEVEVRSVARLGVDAVVVAGDPAALMISLDDEAIPCIGSRVDTVQLMTDDAVAAGQHRLKVEARTGPVDLLRLDVIVGSQE